MARSSGGATTEQSYYETLGTVPPPGKSSLPSALFRHTAKANLLAIVVGVGLGFFLTIEPTPAWLLIVVVALAAIGVDGIVRSYPGANLTSITETSTYAFLPALFVLSAGLLLEYTVDGRWVPLAAAGAGAVFWLTVMCEYISVNLSHSQYGAARFVLMVVTYLTAFAFYGVIYELDVDVVPAALAVGVVSMLLAIEVIRETDLETPYVMAYAGAVGLILGQTRVALYFLPLESFTAALFLLVVFYFINGLLHANFTRSLRPSTYLEYGLVSAIGMLIVVVAAIATD
ncbi:MAG TPA: hypothetical protein VFO84_05825 [Dehalococcoidia bacterium]|nr:hypothetical protein [Dehalococcoidia bacterium]